VNTSTVDQNVNSNSTSNNTNTNNNNNTSDSTSNNTNNNNNTSTSTSDSNVTTNNKNENTNTNNNKNENINKTDQTIKQEITTKAPPASAIAPSIGSSYSQDLCTTGISGAFQGQVFGLSGGKSIRDMNCERIKLSKTVYDMGMKVAAVSLMCQDDRVFQAMEMAGTPCPYMGKIGDEATLAWNDNSQERPDYKDNRRMLQDRQDRIEEEQKQKEREEKEQREQEEYEAEAPKRDFMEQCKGSRHTSGKHEGKRKSGSTCRREWNSLNE
jgi:hypothetical protein